MRDNEDVGSAVGAARAAAQRVGVNEAEYAARVAAGEKWCTACKAWQQRTEFGADRSRGDGLKSRCRRHGARTAPGPTKPQRQTAATLGQAWCSRCEAWRPLADVRGGLCREHRNAAYRERYAATGGRYKRGQAAARRRGVPAVGPDTRELLFEATAGLCAYSCGRLATTLDHVIPIAADGGTGPGLMVPACSPCNSAKRDRDPWPWIDRMSIDALDLVSPGLAYDGAVLDLIDAA